MSADKSVKGTNTKKPRPLKAELHCHCSADPMDSWISYDAKELIDRLAHQGYEVLAITLHNTHYFPREIEQYAASRGLLLIPGAEMRIEGKDVLLYNFTAEEIARIKTLADIARIKKAHHLVIAPHPFYPSHKRFSLGKKLIEHIGMFDAIEYCHFYNGIIGFNGRAQKTAREYAKPLIGTSDGHYLWQFGWTTTHLHAQKTKEAVIDAIKRGKATLSTRALPLRYMLKVITSSLARDMERISNKILGKQGKKAHSSSQKKEKKQAHPE